MPILCASLAIVLLDQVTKAWVLHTMALGERIEVIPGLFNWSHVQNTGAAWGVMQGLSHWLVALSFVMLAAMIAFRRQLIGDTFYCRLVLGIMIGGVWGNLLDRIKLGYVVDFMDFHWKARHFPAFNVADAAICVGVGLYFLIQLAERKQDQCKAG